MTTVSFWRQSKC